MKLREWQPMAVKKHLTDMRGLLLDGKVLDEEMGPIRAFYRVPDEWHPKGSKWHKDSVLFRTSLHAKKVLIKRLLGVKTVEMNFYMDPEMPEFVRIFPWHALSRDSDIPFLRKGLELCKDERGLSKAVILEDCYALILPEGGERYQQLLVPQSAIGTKDAQGGGPNHVTPPTGPKLSPAGRRKSPLPV